ncbi:MAG TPA: hypothetical protein VK498_11735 [Ferruginibacter sp.]|nr:hypothetical protein [Ferruginibacter sp.]
MNKIIFLGVWMVFSANLIAQVPVSSEPRHHPVFENKYLRLLDVWIPPRDTSLFHTHSTPSLFLHLSNTYISSQLIGKEWIREQAIYGKTWFRSFSPDSMVHRVANLDKVPLHVIDIEILSGYDSLVTFEPMSLPLIYENEKSYAYRLTDSTINSNIIQNRGPMVATLAAGSKVHFYNANTNKSTEILQGKYLYIEPGTSFYFIPSKGEINLVLFEIK